MMLNPILARELRARSRRIGTTVSLTLFLLIMTGVGLIVWATTETVSSFTTNPVDGATVGTNLFEWTVIAMILVMCFIIPGFTGSAISGERDRQTLVPMQVSMLSPREIVIGKLQASLAYTAYLLVACLPLFAISFVVGGVTVVQLLLGAVALAGIAIMLGSMSIMASTLMRRTGPATVLSYAFMLTLLVGFPLLAVLLEALTSTGNDFEFLAYPNPIVFAGTMLDAGSSYSGGSSPLSGSFDLSWIPGALAYLAISAVTLFVASRRVRIPSETDR